MIQVVNKLHYWASMYDYIKFDPDLENPNGVKSVTVNQKIDSEWVEVASKEGEDLFNSEGNLFYQHASLSESSGTLFSPGTKIDGTNFN